MSFYIYFMVIEFQINILRRSENIKGVPFSVHTLFSRRPKKAVPTTPYFSYEKRALRLCIFMLKCMSSVQQSFKTPKQFQE